MKLPNITVFTDASFCHQTAAAGGAYWARTQDQFAQGSWNMMRCCGAHIAELQAVSRACLDILKGHTNITVPPTFRLIVVTDCEAVKRYIETGGGCGTIPTALENRVQWLHRQIAEHPGSELRVNHVKGHTGRQDPRSYVNRWCDREAKKRMREQRKAIIEQRSIQECKSILEDGS